MRFPNLYFAPGVVVDGIQPPTIKAIAVLSYVFGGLGLDCWVTSVVRPGDVDSLHAYGMAVDVDAPTKLTEGTWYAIKTQTRGLLKDDYDVVTHRGRSGKMHCHTEYDPGGLGVAPYQETE